ncbi:histone deacetylase 9-B [Alosa sapidissima]|uniref:histone deacetylase 9-B n=1 Tax=Alosa sapidissima TaxID=34773 RepID=UPI001C08FC7C|nr:histone deacetylase 9-B [Alosa sapidissima]
MLQTIYEGNSCFSTDNTYQHQQLASQHNMHNINDSVNIKPEMVLSVDPVSPLDLRTDVRLLDPGSDPAVWERQLQEELLLIQKQQQHQKQLLISEFQKQHENLLRQHQAQLQEHLKLQQELQVVKYKQELLQKEKQQEEQNPNKEQDGLRQELQSAPLRSRERNREAGAVASTQVKQKLQEFLLSKTTKDALSSGSHNSLGLSPKQWYIASHHTSLDQSSPPLGDTLPPSKFILPFSQDSKDDFPLRKTASEPNLKIRSRLKQKVVERRSSPLLKRNEGTITAPFKKRALELLESTEINSSESGPSSPKGASSAIGAENGPSSLPTTTRTERWPSQPRLVGPDGPVSVLSLYTSPSLPNITLGLAASSSPISAAPGGGGAVVRHGLPTQLLGPVPLPLSQESKASSSQQALLQHLLQKEQIRQQRIISSGQSPVSPQSLSPLATKERSLCSGRSKLPRHRPLKRTQSAPLPQSTLAQLVIQQQHFLDKQKNYQQQVSFSKLLSQSIEQSRQPCNQLVESEDEQPREQSMPQERSPSGGVIRKHSTSNGTHLHSSTDPQLTDSRGNPNPAPIHEVINVKQEPTDSDEEIPPRQVSTYQPQVKGRLVIRAIN